MKKKYVVALLHTFVGDRIQIMDREEYGLALCKSEILFESDDYKEAVEFFTKKPK